MTNSKTDKPQGILQILCLPELVPFVKMCEKHEIPITLLITNTVYIGYNAVYVSQENIVSYMKKIDITTNEAVLLQQVFANLFTPHNTAASNTKKPKS